MAQDLSPGKSVCILAVVVGCFAILWPSIFYPMLKSSMFPSGEDENGCCQVLSDKDVNGIKLVTHLCHAVLKQTEKFDLISSQLNTQTIGRCRSLINDTCDVDIKSLLKDKIRLDPGYTSTLEQLRTANKSFCLKYHFDINLDLLGAPHRLKKLDVTSALKFPRQERSPYLRPNAMHPALRERGRAVPQPQTPPKISRERASPPPPVIAAKKPPIPGMRPPMGGGSHVHTQKGSGPVGILMPLYTVGIVIFFAYTITKLVCKKQDNSSQYTRDPDFCRLVFQNNTNESKQCADEKKNCSVSNDTSKLVVSAISSLLQEVNRDILEREIKEERHDIQLIEAQNGSLDRSTLQDSNQNDFNSTENQMADNVQEEQIESKNNQFEDTNSPQVNGVIQVVGMEMNESCENGQLWKHSTIDSKKCSILNGTLQNIVADEIILPANVPAHSQILVSNTSTKNVAEEPSIILESKVTLNVISNDSQNRELNESNHLNGDEEDEDKEDEDEENEDKKDEDEEDEVNEIANTSENEQENEERRISFDREDVPSTEL